MPEPPPCPNRPHARPISHAASARRTADVGGRLWEAGPFQVCATRRDGDTCCRGCKHPYHPRCRQIWCSPTCPTLCLPPSVPLPPASFLLDYLPSSPPPILSTSHPLHLPSAPRKPQAASRTPFHPPHLPSAPPPIRTPTPSTQAIQCHPPRPRFRCDCTLPPLRHRSASAGQAQTVCLGGVWTYYPTRGNDRCGRK